MAHHYLDQGVGALSSARAGAERPSDDDTAVTRIAVEKATGEKTADKKTFYQGTHRTCSPEQTWRRVSPCFPKVGISRVADVTRLDRIGIPVYQAIRPRSLNLSVSQGKGASSIAAKVSAVMEAIELWHVEDLSHVPQEVTALREMDRHNPIPASSLRWLSDARSFGALPIPWLVLDSLTRERRGWLPRQMAELDFTTDTCLQPRMFMQTSNGLASGNTREEALLHGLCELIERHGVFLAKDDVSRRRGLDPDSIETAFCRRPLQQMLDAGMRVGIYDLTWEVAVPTILVELVGDDLPVVWRGSGTHPSSEVALSRALTEAAQSRLTFIAGARDDLPETSPGLDPQGFFHHFQEPPPERRLHEIADLSSPSVEQDLDRVLAELHRNGFEPFGVALDRSDLGLDVPIPVALTYVPGLLEVTHG